MELAEIGERLGESLGQNGVSTRKGELMKRRVEKMREAAEASIEVSLANQDEVIRLSIDEDYYERREVPNVNDSSLLIPPLDLVVRSLYPNAKVDWNGAEPIL